MIKLGREKGESRRDAIDAGMAFNVEPQLSSLLDFVPQADLAVADGTILASFLGYFNSNLGKLELAGSFLLLQLAQKNNPFLSPS